MYPARNRLLPGAPQFVKTTLRCRLQDGKFVRDKRNRRNASLLFSFSLFISFFFFSNSCLFVSPTPLNRRMRLEGFNWRLVSFPHSTNSLGDLLLLARRRLTASFVSHSRLSRKKTKKSRLDSDNYRIIIVEICCGHRVISTNVKRMWREDRRIF